LPASSIEISAMDQDQRQYLASLHEIEIDISAARAARNWDRVMRLIETYTSLFDRIPNAAAAAPTAPSTGAIKSFYWVCMAEISFEMKNDVTNAIDSCKRALAMDPLNSSAKILAAKILLEMGGQIIYESGRGGKKPRRAARNIMICEDINAEDYMAETLKVCTTKLRQVVAFVTYFLWFDADVSKGGETCYSGSFADR
jgi:two-component SAPR family response regulator